MSLHGHRITAKRELVGTFTDEDWDQLKRGATKGVTFHPMWLPSGHLVVWVGRHPPGRDDPRVAHLIRAGAVCCPYPITEEVTANLESGGMTVATFKGADFTVGFVLERFATLAQKEGRR